MVGPRNINALFQGSGLAACIEQNAGDPIVLYDKWAQRWVLSQFTAQPPYGECVAVSTTSDATGTYYRYFINVCMIRFFFFFILCRKSVFFFLSGVRMVSLTSFYLPVLLSSSSK